jgi:transcriptional regulator with XRE-family HTH domain
MKKSTSDFILEGVPDLMKMIGSNIRTARINRNMTIKELANRVHVDEKTISRLESGQPSTNLKNLISILIVFGLEDGLYTIANPQDDEVGKALASKRQRVRVRNINMRIDDDF